MVLQSSMARFGRTFGRGSGGGRTVPTKTCLSSLHKLSRPLREEKTSAPLGFLTFPLKSTRVLFKEIALSGKCKNTVICGKKSMTKNANVENVGSINNPPGCFYIHLGCRCKRCLCTCAEHPTAKPFESRFQEPISPALVSISSGGLHCHGGTSIAGWFFMGNPITLKFC